MWYPGPCFLLLINHSQVQFSLLSFYPVHLQTPHWFPAPSIQVCPSIPRYAFASLEFHLLGAIVYLLALLATHADHDRLPLAMASEIGLIDKIMNIIQNPRGAGS